MGTHRTQGISGDSMEGRTLRLDHMRAPRRMHHHSGDRLRLSKQQQMQGSPPPPPPPSSSSAAGDPYAGYGGARGGGVEDGEADAHGGGDRIQLAPFARECGDAPTVIE